MLRPCTLTRIAVSPQQGCHVARPACMFQCVFKSQRSHPVRAWVGNVLVTAGAAEANAITVAILIRQGDSAIVMEPGHRQVPLCPFLIFVL